ncbi:MAG: hypothetical protein IT445_08000 [Phycisphaeraceae bacterium]|nr:hypothetical protein [Phycisphaeraceae bacterium]
MRSQRWVIMALALMISLPLTISTARADWNPGDGYKMHYPQLPDPNGWDVEFVSLTNKIGDDWLCTGTGPVSDIHIWLSWQKDNIEGGGLPGVIDNVGVEIYSNVNPDALLPYSRPGDLLWSRSFSAAEITRRSYGQGDQGWYSPQLGMQQGTAWSRPDHQFFEQMNITNFDAPFIQTEGEIYWLVMWVDWIGTQNPAGWKTSESPHFMDDAVWYDYLEPNPDLRWHEIVDPITMQSLDLAFVITPEPTTLLLAGCGLLLMAWPHRR